MVRSRIVQCAVVAAIFATAAGASAQGPGRRPRNSPPPSPGQPKPGASPSDDDDDHAPLLRTEPEIAPPSDPLAVSPEVQGQIGTDWDGRPPSPEGAASTSWFPYYERRAGDSRLRLL